MTFLAQKLWSRAFLITVLFSSFLGIYFASFSSESAATSNWRNLEPGMDMGLFLAPKKSIVGDSLIKVLRADPHFFALKLLNSSASKTKKKILSKNVGQAKLFSGWHQCQHVSKKSSLKCFLYENWESLK